MTEIWTNWESRVVNGIFPLRRFLGRSNHSVVFLTEHKAKALPNAAIKLVPADPALTEAQLMQWRSTAALSHPHLLRLFDAGRCELGGHKFLFVVMEYAEQNLAQILPNRALTLDEVREMLRPTVDALAFLHRKNLVQGRLKPPNLMVVDDQLKLASDTIHPAGKFKARLAKPSLYDSPEAKEGIFSPAGDVWGLAVTVVEALTQSLPAWHDASHESVSLPATLPREYVDVIRRSLSRNPAHRPPVIELADQINQAPTIGWVAEPAVPESPVQATPLPGPAKALSRRGGKFPRWLVPAAAGIFLILAAVWAGVILFESPRSENQRISEQSGSSASPTLAPTASTPAATALPPKPSLLSPTTAAAALTSESSAKTDAPSVVHEEIPNVPRRALQAIRGHIKVTVRVRVDPSGKVIAESLEVPGSSRYFAKLAIEAARRWKFASADQQNLRKWLLHFDFSRGGVTGRAVGPR